MHAQRVDEKSSDTWCLLENEKSENIFK